MGKRVVFEQTDEFCTCKNPKPRYETKEEQYGGKIRTIIVGEYCESCRKPVAPKGEIDME